MPVKDANGNVQGVKLTYNNGIEQVMFSRTCARTLEYPLRMYVLYYCHFYGLFQSYLSWDQPR